MVSSSSFVSIQRDYTALFRLAFASAPGSSPLTSPRQITRRLILQEARRHPRFRIGLRLLVSSRFQVLFHSPVRGTFHLSLTVLVLYRSLNVFSLGKWSSQLHAVLACTALLRSQLVSPQFRLRGSHPLCRTFPRPSASASLFPLFADPTTPISIAAYRFGLLPFRSPLLREFSLFLRLLRCFSSPGSPQHTIYSYADD